MAQQQRSKHVPQRKRQQIAAHIVLGHAVKPHQDQRVSEKDRVVEKRLGQHQHKTENRTPAMFVHDRVPNFVPRCMRARSNTREECGGSIGVLEWWSNGFWRRCITPMLLYSITPLRSDPSFHFADDPLCFVVAPMNHQPSRTLRNPASKENHNETE